MIQTISSWLNSRRHGLTELAVWIAIYGAFAVPMALGETNGIGYFQQPQGISLWAPLALGGAVNAWIIYLHAFKAMPFLLQRGRRNRYIPALALIFIVYLISHLTYQIALAWTMEPILRRLSVIDWTVENLKAAPVVFLLSGIYKFGRDWVVHMSEHQALAQRTSALETELRLVKQEFADLQNDGPEKSFLKFESSRRMVQTPVGAIQYVKAAGNYVEIVTSDKSYTVYGAIKEIVDRLPSNQFSRIHRSYIVNLRCIKAINKKHVEIGELQLPIGATYKAALFQKWTESK